MIELIRMNIWEEIKSKLDIVDIISEYIPVTMSGTNYRASSPFKKEKTPSLMISPQKQIWHDFASGRGGDIFGFVVEMENITRGEALRKLAEKAGVKLTNQNATPSLSPQEKTIQESGYDVLNWTADFYHSILKKILTDRSHPVTQYCLKRRLTPELINQFKLGYAPPGNFLLKFLEKNSKSTGIFEQLELLVTRSFLKDKFTDRLMIPIRNLEGKTVGFTGRVLPYDTTDRPKYLNSSQSAWFDKSKIWFGLDTARRSIMLEKKVIIVEGNMDVIAAFGEGLTYTVASQGTSFTNQQLTIIKRFSSSITLAYDNDSAGILAAEKLFLTGTPLGLTINQFVIPEIYKDLDEYLEKNSSSSLNTSYYLENWIRRNQDRLTSTDPAVQKATIQEICKLISVVDDITTEQYIQLVHTLTNISTTTLVKIIQSNKNIAPQNLKKAGETESELSTNTNSQEDLLITFQKIASVCSLESEVVNIKLLNISFLLLSRLLPIEETDYNDYITVNSDQLNMVREHTNLKNEIATLKPLFQNLETLFDRQSTLLIGDDSLFQTYYTFKQLVQEL